MIVRSIVVPLAGVYALFLTMLVMTERRRRSSRVADAPVSRDGPPGTRRLVRHLAVTTAGGYATFLVLVGGYYFLVARQTRRILEQALVGGAFLAFAVALPALSFFGRLESVRAARSRPGRRGARPPS